MKLLHVVPTYFPATRYGGPLWAVHGLCRALAARGHEVTVFTTSVDGAAESAVPIDTPVELEGVTVRYFRSRWLRRLYWSPTMARRLREEVGRFDVVHCHSSFLWPPWAAAREARRAGRPYLFAPHGMLVAELVRERGRWRKTAWIRLLEAGTLHGAAGVHVATPAEAADVAKLGFPACRFFVVPFGIDAAEAGTDRGVPAHPPVVLFLGRVTWKKGLDVLVDAMSRVPEAVLVVAGNDEEGYTERLRWRAAGHGLGERIRFVGPCYGEAKTALLRSASVFVLPSRNENFGVAVLEAMAAGVPVVVSEGVGLAGEVSSAGAGLAVPATVEAVSGALTALLGDADRRRAMGAAGRRLASARFSWDAVGARMEAVLSEVLGGQ